MNVDRKWNLNQLLFFFANDTALVADSEKLKKMVEEFGRVFERRKVRVNEIKSKVIKYTMWREWMRNDW